MEPLTVSVRIVMIHVIDGLFAWTLILHNDFYLRRGLSLKKSLVLVLVLSFFTVMLSSNIALAKKAGLPEIYSGWTDIGSGMSWRFVTVEALRSYDWDPPKYCNTPSYVEFINNDDTYKDVKYRCPTEATLNRFMLSPHKIDRSPIGPDSVKWFEKSGPKSFEIEDLGHLNG